jgi:uncharacterized protein (UPF0332 family)
MKKIDFLSKLRKEGRIEVVETNDTLTDSYMQKSRSYLKSAKILLENKQLEESVSLVYYSMYYMLNALLYKTGIKCENHSAAIILLKELFGLDNSKIRCAKKERIDKQYYVSFSISLEETRDLIRTAEIFNSDLLDYTEKLNTDKISQIRERLMGLMD